MVNRVRDAAELAGQQSSTVVLDALDRDIIALLTEDARLSVRAIARELGRSPGAISERLGRLEASRVIVGYYADIDLSRLGYMHMLLGIRLDSDDVLDTCAEAILGLDEIKRLWVVTGSWALVAEAHVRDTAHLRELLLHLMRGISGVQHTEAMIVLDSGRSPVPAASPVSAAPLAGVETVALLDDQAGTD